MKTKHEKIVEVLELFDVGPSYAQMTVHNQSAVSFREMLVDRILEQLEPEGEVSDKDIQDHIRTTRYKDGTCAMDEQTFYEGAKWMRSKLAPQQPSDGEIEDVFVLNADYVRIKRHYHYLMTLEQFKAAINELNQ